MNCPHSVRERTYSGDECPVCLAADRDKLQAEVESYQREMKNWYGKLEAADENLKVAELQVCELRKALSKFTDGERGHRADSEGSECLEHGIIGVPREWPCPVAVAQRLLRNPPDLSSETQEDRTKVVEQQVYDLKKVVELLLECEAEREARENRHESKTLAAPSGGLYFAAVYEAKKHRTHDLRNQPHPPRVEGDRGDVGANPAPPAKPYRTHEDFGPRVPRTHDDYGNA